MSSKNFFNKEQSDAIVAAITKAELNTSGEIRLHMVDTCKKDPLTQAIETFGKLGMTSTESRNGVLIFLSVKDKKFAIVGDEGINKVVPEGFWDSTKEIILNEFRNGNFLSGLCLGIEEVGMQLKQYFPYQKDDVNELPNEISYE